MLRFLGFTIAKSERGTGRENYISDGSKIINYGYLSETAGVAVTSRVGVMEATLEAKPMCLSFQQKVIGYIDLGSYRLELLFPTVAVNTY